VKEHTVLDVLGAIAVAMFSLVVAQLVQKFSVAGLEQRVH